MVSFLGTGADVLIDQEPCPARGHLLRLLSLPGVKSPLLSIYLGNHGGHRQAAEHVDERHAQAVQIVQVRGAEIAELRGRDDHRVLVSPEPPDDLSNDRQEAETEHR